jgi:starvation-inducible outer membrane lipoprotein
VLGVIVAVAHQSGVRHFDLAERELGNAARGTADGDDNGGRFAGKIHGSSRGL